MYTRSGQRIRFGQKFAFVSIEKISVVLLNLVEALLQIQDSKKVVQEDVKQEKQPKSAP
jgi:hypothetical protein